MTSRWHAISIVIPKPHVFDLARLRHAAAARASGEFVPKVRKPNIGREAFEQPINPILPAAAASLAGEPQNGAALSIFGKRVGAVGH